MPCYHPVSAFRLSSGQVVFGGRLAQAGDPLSLPCGQCIGCRLERSRQWAVRCVHEASLHDENCFITLTYNDASLPVGGSLEYRVFQLFMKRLRAAYPDKRIRFFMCGEYGESLGRPHFHACLFGFRFPDCVLWKSGKGVKLFRSASLEKLWSYGHSSVGAVTFESAAYVARYIVDKITGDAAAGWYQRVDKATGEVYDLMPEFCHMSLKPGIGHDWMRLYWPEVAREGCVVARGVEAKAPKYYDKLMRHLQRFENVEYRRAVKARLTAGENTDERLAVREVVARARLSLSKRNTL